MTRGERNCNPLNIRLSPATKWRGQAEQQNDPHFVQFTSMLWGLRAAYCILATYKRKYQLTCIEDIIHRWAPPSENDTKAYVETVCRLTGYGGKERLEEKQWDKLVQAMAQVESGIKFDENTLKQAHDLYNCPNKKSESYNN